jgi:hypothetical protein
MIDLTTIDDNKEQEAMYLYKWLLGRHDFFWRQSDDHRFLDKNIEREKQILKLKEICDPTGIIYNQFNPFKK